MCDDVERKDGCKAESQGFHDLSGGAEKVAGNAADAATKDAREQPCGDRGGNDGKEECRIPNVEWRRPGT